MYGFTGYLSITKPNNTVDFLQCMGKSITHRGPDDSGVWCDNEAGIGLAHRRLSIVELSPAGHEPMLSGSGRYVLAFNGEIYNHLALRVELEKISPSPSLLKGESIGILVPPKNEQLLAEGLLKMIALPETQCEQMGLRAKERVMTEFTMEKVVAMLNQVYQEVMQRNDDINS